MSHAPITLCEFHCDDCQQPHPLAQSIYIIGDGRSRQLCKACHDRRVKDVYRGNVKEITIADLRVGPAALLGNG